MGEENPARQISGMWNQVQQNLFFAVESGFNGRLIDRFLWGNSFIHAPLEMTEEDNGLPIKSYNEK
ncbi:MAG: carbon-nitrogen hydrolase family protein, partial [Bacillota bacterium]